MEILLFKKTKDSDLNVGLQVCYSDTYGAYTKLGNITDIIEQDGVKLYLLNTAMGAYMAEELKLIKNEAMTYKQLLAAGHVFDASGVTNPFVFEWEEKDGIYYPVDFKLLSICIYKFPLGDSTNGGISGGDTKDVYIPCADGPYKALSPHVNQRFILIPEQRSKGYWSLQDVFKQDGMVGPMSGGNLAYSSDSRCRQVYHIHDRFETPETYRALSI